MKRNNNILVMWILCFIGAFGMGWQQSSQKQKSRQQTAQQQYIQKLQAAQTEKDKWYALVQKQNIDLSKTRQALDAAQNLLKKDIPDAIKNDEKNNTVCYSGIGSDSLRLYNQALGYSTEH